MSYLYGVTTHLHKIEIGVTKILKVSNKTIKVENYISPYDLIVISKDHPDLAYSEGAAIAIFISNQNKKITQLEDRIAGLKQNIESANDLY